MVRHHVNRSQRSLEVVAPYLKSFKNGKQFLVMDIVVEFGGHKGAGVESTGVDFIVHWRYHGEDGGKGVVQRICFDYEGEPGIQCVSTGAVVKASSVY